MLAIVIKVVDGKKSSDGGRGVSSGNNRSSGSRSNTSRRRGEMACARRELLA